MRDWKKLVALGVMAAVSVSALAGCGEKGSNSQGRVEPTADIWDAYEEEVTISTVVEQNAGTIFRDGEDWDHNAWYQAYKDRFNINVVNDWVSDDYGTKLNLAIADGDIPDVFHASAAQLRQLYEAGLIMDLTDILDQYGSDTLKSYYDYDSDTFETGFFDGKLYGLPKMSYGIIDQFQYVWIRKDWKDQLEMEDPKSMDDVIDIAKAFQENFGGYPIAEHQSLDNMKRLALGWGAHPDLWITKEDGTIEFGSIQPEMKEVLSAYAEWYKEGIINPDFTTYNQEKVFQDLINGVTGVIPFAQWLGYQPGPDIITNLGSDAIFEPYPIPSATGEEVKGSVNFGNAGYIAISKNCKNPEAVMKLLNFYCYMMDDAQETEDPEFIMSLFDDCYTNIAYSLSITNPQTDYKQFISVIEALEKYESGEAVDTTALGKDASKYNSCVDWMTKQDPKGVGDWLQQGNEKSAYRIAKNYVDNETYVKNALWGINPDSLDTMGGALGDILTEGFTKIVIGEEDIDYFDTIVQMWKDAGGDQVTKDVNEMYGEK